MNAVDNTKYPEPAIMRTTEKTDNVLDRMQAAYKAEYDRWDWRARTKKRGSPYEIFRNCSKNNDLIGDCYFEVVTFTQRECQNIGQIENWLETFRGRAATKAALDVYGSPTGYV